MSLYQKTLRRLTAHYCLIQMLINVIYLIIVSFASVFLRYRGFDDLQIGMLMAVGTVLSILTQPVLGDLADRMRQIRLGAVTAVFHIAMLPLALFLMLYRGNLMIIAAAFVLLRYLVSASDPFETSMAMEMVNHGYPVNFGLARGVGSVGYSSASYLLGKAVSGLGEEILMPGVIVLSLVAAVVMTLFCVPHAGISAEKEKKRHDETLGLFDFMRRNVRFCIIILGVALLHYCHDVRASYMYQIVVGIGGTAEDFGSITAFTSMIEIPALVCFSRLQKRFSVRSLLLFSSVFLIVRVLVICYASNIAWLYVAGALQILSYGLFAPAVVYYVNDIVGEANRNKGQTFLSTAFCISAVLGSLIGGSMLSAAGGDPHDMLIAGALVSAVGAAILFILKPGSK